MTFPDRRLRRLRRTPAIRQLVAETRVGVDDLIAPLFVRENCENPQPIHSMPGVMQHSQESLREEVRQLRQLGVGGIILFGLPERKDNVGSEAWNHDGVVQVALKNLRDEHGDDIVAIADLCVDEYTDHGHCGIVTSSGEIDNDATLELYQKTALAQVEAGADMVAPSGMMDGQVAAIRQALDANGHQLIPIMAYSAKYASAEYGPFREAVDVTITGGGNRKTYQQDPANAREAMEEIRLDVAEGADLIMVKPALAYLDIIYRARQEFDLPLAAYHVSGEYAMLKAAAANGWIDGLATGIEHLTAIKRAGADLILTYLTREVAEALQ